MSSTTLLLLIILPALVSCHHHPPNATISDAISRACTSIALQDRSIPYDLCSATLAESASPDHGDMAEAAIFQALNSIHNIQMDMVEAEGRFRGDAVAVGRYSACRRSFGPVRGELSSAREVVYEGRKHGFAIRHLRTALHEVRGALGKCERQLTGLKLLTTGNKQVETAIKIAEMVLH